MRWIKGFLIAAGILGALYLADQHFSQGKYSIAIGRMVTQMRQFVWSLRAGGLRHKIWGHRGADVKIVPCSANRKQLALREWKSTNPAGAGHKKWPRRVIHAPRPSKGHVPAAASSDFGSAVRRQFAFRSRADGYQALAIFLRHVKCLYPCFTNRRHRSAFRQQKRPQ